MLSGITYNIQKGKKLENITAWLLRLSEFPDVLCLQEFPEPEVSSFIKKIQKKQDIEYAYAVGFRRDETFFGQLTIVKKNTLHIEESRILTLGKSVIENRVTKDPTERSALITVISQKNKKFILVNTHLVCLSLNRSRIKQLQKILLEIQGLRLASHIPLVVLGDFNYSTLTGQRKLLQLMQSEGFLNAYKKHTHRLFYLKHQIDYVFYKHCFIDNVNVLRLKLSDHYCISFNLDFVAKTKKKIALFDFDGTIANTIPTTPLIVKLFNKFAKDLGFEQRVTAKDVEKFREKSLREIISTLHIRFYKLPFILRKVQKGMRADLQKAEPISGMKDVLYELKNHGYTLGIVSSGKQDLVEDFLHKYNLNIFDVVAAGSSLFGKHRNIQKLLKKNDFTKEETIYVGDEIRDIEATKKVGVHMIAVTWGFNNKKGLQRYVPNFLAEKPKELLDILL